MFLCLLFNTYIFLKLYIRIIIYQKLRLHHIYISFQRSLTEREDEKVKHTIIWEKITANHS